MDVHLPHLSVFPSTEPGKNSKYVMLTYLKIYAADDWYRYRRSLYSFNFLFFVAWSYFLFLTLSIMTQKYTGGGLVHTYHRHQSLIIITH